MALHYLVYSIFSLKISVPISHSNPHCNWTHQQNQIRRNVPTAVSKTKYLSQSPSRSFRFFLLRKELDNQAWCTSLSLSLFLEGGGDGRGVGMGYVSWQESTEQLSLLHHLTLMLLHQQNLQVLDRFCLNILLPAPNLSVHCSENHCFYNVTYPDLETQ